VFRRILGPNRVEVAGKWRKLHNEELSELYSSPNIVRVIKLRRTEGAVHVPRMRERKGVYRVSVEKTEGKTRLGRPRRRWEDNIKKGFQGVGCGAWIGLIWLMIGTCGRRL